LTDYIYIELSFKNIGVSERGFMSEQCNIIIGAILKGMMTLWTTRHFCNKNNHKQ